MLPTTLPKGECSGQAPSHGPDCQVEPTHTPWMLGTGSTKGPRSGGFNSKGRGGMWGAPPCQGLLVAQLQGGPATEKGTQAEALRGSSKVFLLLFQKTWGQYPSYLQSIWWSCSCRLA